MHLLCDFNVAMYVMNDLPDAALHTAVVSVESFKTLEQRRCGGAVRSTPSNCVVDSLWNKSFQRLVLILYRPLVEITPAENEETDE